MSDPIELPEWAVPNGASAALVDAGGVMRSPLNTAALRVDRPGSHYRIALSFPVFDEPRDGRVIVSRLIRAKRQGLRVPYPLPESQGAVGSPVVDGAGQAGLTLMVRGLTPRVAIREGFWLSIEAASGQHFLHNVAGEVLAGADGRAALTLSEMLRAPFLDGARVHLARPMVEGVVDGGEQAWSLSVEHQVSIECMLEEAG